MYCLLLLSFLFWSILRKREGQNVPRLLSNNRVNFRQKNLCSAKLKISFFRYFSLYFLYFLTSWPSSPPRPWRPSPWPPLRPQPPRPSPAGGSRAGGSPCCFMKSGGYNRRWIIKCDLGLPRFFYIKNNILDFPVGSQKKKEKGYPFPWVLRRKKSRKKPPFPIYVQYKVYAVVWHFPWFVSDHFRSFPS